MVVRALNKGNGKNSEKLCLENNFTQIPNEVLEALAKTHLSPNESKIVFLVIRKTYGWHKSEDWISLGQIEEYTGITRCNVCRYIKSLAQRKILIKMDNKDVGLNEETAQWTYEGLSISTIGCYQY